MMCHRLFAGALSLLAAAAATFGQIEYELVIIEPWDTQYQYASSGASGLNNLNQVSGGASPLPGGSTSFLWTRETGKVAVNFAGRINDNGVMAGGGYIRWPDGTLEPMGAGISGVGGINNHDVAAGSTGSVHTCPPHAQRDSSVWFPELGVMNVDQTFGTPDTDQAWGINNHNVIVGVRSWTGQCGDQKAFYLDMESGVYIDLHDELTHSPSGITKAFAVNDSGVVVGDGPHEGAKRPFVWSIADGFTFIPAIPGGTQAYTIGKAINNAGVVAGGGIVDSDGWHAFIWDAQRGMRDLNNHVVRPADFVVDNAEFINDNGWIVGTGHYGAWSPTRAVVLIPIEAACPGDYNGDGVRDTADFFEFFADFFATPPDADYNGDGATDTADFFEFFADFFGTPCA